MTSKQRAELRAKANTLEPVFQVGKGGVSDALIAQTSDALRARELIKLKVLLETAPESPRELAEQIAAATGSEVVQVVGGSMVFYIENPELRDGKKKPAKKADKNKGKPLSKVRAKRELDKKREQEAKQYNSRKAAERRRSTSQRQKPTKKA